MFPRWFLVVVSVACLVSTVAVATLAVALSRPSGRYVRLDDRGILDTRTGTVCGVGPVSNKIGCRAITVGGMRAER